jgi:hypothetical protein
MRLQVRGAAAGLLLLLVQGNQDRGGPQAPHRGELQRGRAAQLVTKHSFGEFAITQHITTFVQSLHFMLLSACIQPNSNCSSNLSQNVIDSREFPCKLYMFDCFDEITLCVV